MEDLTKTVIGKNLDIPLQNELIAAAVPCLANKLNLCAQKSSCLLFLWHCSLKNKSNVNYECMEKPLVVE